MPAQTTSNLSNSVRTAYAGVYKEACMAERLYDQLALPVSQDGVEMAARLAAAIQVPYIGELPIATEAISQLADLTPRSLRDAVASITTTSRADAILWAEAVDIQTYTNYGEARFRAIGKQHILSVDWLAMVAALTGSLVERAAARASLDAGTSADRLSDADFSAIEATLQSLDCPTFDDKTGNYWVAIMHPAVFHDLRTGGNILNVGVYQDKAIILNSELGRVGHFKILVSGRAKVFGAAGADNASNVATTLAASVETAPPSNQALSKTIEVASASNISAGKWLWLGTEETGNTLDPLMEQVKWVSTSSTTITIAGGAANGGLKYDHAVGTPVRNADSVYPVVFGHPGSIAKAYDSGMESEFGTIVGPKVSGTVDQFATLGWKFYGGYGRFRETGLVRGEFSTSLEA